MIELSGFQVVDQREVNQHIVALYLKDRQEEMQVVFTDTAKRALFSGEATYVNHADRLLGLNGWAPIDYENCKKDVSKKA